MKRKTSHFNHDTKPPAPEDQIPGRGPLLHPASPASSSRPTPKPEEK